MGEYTKQLLKKLNQLITKGQKKEEKEKDILDALVKKGSWLAGIGRWRSDELVQMVSLLCSGIGGEGMREEKFIYLSLIFLNFF